MGVGKAERDRICVARRGIDRVKRNMKVDMAVGD